MGRNVRIHQLLHRHLFRITRVGGGCFEVRVRASSDARKQKDGINNGENATFDSHEIVKDPAEIN